MKTHLQNFTVTAFVCLRIL